MSIKRNKEVRTEPVANQEELNEIIELVCDDLSGNIEDIETYKEYLVNDIFVTRTINKYDQMLWGLSIHAQMRDEYLYLESGILQFIAQQHINSYNQSIKQEKEIRKDRRNGY